MQGNGLPRVVLICHDEDALDRVGLASWLASTMRLAGLIVIRNDRRRLWRAAKREITRVGWLRFLDVVAFRAYSRLRLAGANAAWTADTLTRVRARYPASLASVPQIVVDTPNAPEARAFLERLEPDLLIARCKFILKKEIFQRARVGTFVLHPGVCPEYRNAHGCFWALVNRDLARVGMTLLRVDEGIDTGPMYLHGTCAIDEVRETHHMIQGRVVFENLEAIGGILHALCRGEEVPTIPTAGRKSATWGQPRLTDYFRWKRQARRAQTLGPRSGPWRATRAEQALVTDPGHATTGVDA